MGQVWGPNVVSVDKTMHIVATMRAAQFTSELEREHAYLSRASGHTPYDAGETMDTRFANVCHLGGHTPLQSLSQRHWLVLHGQCVEQYVCLKGSIHT